MSGAYDPGPIENKETRVQSFSKFITFPVISLYSAADGGFQNQVFNLPHKNIL